MTYYVIVAKGTKKMVVADLFCRDRQYAMEAVDRLRLNNVEVVEADVEITISDRLQT